jgi:hypothetical protein
MHALICTRPYKHTKVIDNKSQVGQNPRLPHMQASNFSMLKLRYSLIYPSSKYLPVVDERKKKVLSLN